MNFIGHAAVALWTSESPARVLGAMLPDLAGMVRVKLGTTDHPDMADGIALHHRTDDVFHASPTFVSLMTHAMQQLTTLGVSRGPARAVAHVGTELFIDGELLRDASIGAAYLRALEAQAPLPAQLVGERDTDTFEALRRRLLKHGIPHDYRQPEEVLLRLSWMLAPRPRLALDAHARDVLRRTLPDLQCEVASALSRLLSELRSSL